MTDYAQTYISSEPIQWYKIEAQMNEHAGMSQKEKQYVKFIICIFIAFVSAVVAITLYISKKYSVQTQSKGESLLTKSKK
jgi:hypothetical protein